MPLFATVGLREKAIRPLAIDDLVRVLRAALVDACLARQTVARTGAQALYLSEAARCVAQVLDRRVWIFRAPVWLRLLAEMFEVTMKVPLIAKAQVQNFFEGVVERVTECDPLPADLLPVLRFAEAQISGGPPESGAFGVHDLRCGA
jgi:NADH dehydrogenase